MIFEWDQNKNIANKAKHKVSFETASLVFFDEFHRTLFERTENGEDRWHTIRMVEGVCSCWLSIPTGITMEKKLS